MTLYKLPLKRIRQESPSITSFIFKKPHGFNYEAGQFCKMTLLLPNNVSEHRFYSFASSPTEKELLVSVRLSQSEFNSTLSKIPIGTNIDITMPFGKLILPKDNTSDVCFLAGGIGIAPFRGMLKYLFDTKKKQRATLIYSNKMATDIPFLDELQALGKHSLFSFHYVLTQSHILPHPDFIKGRISTEVLQQKIPHYKQTFYFICGGTSFVTSCLEMLTKLGVSSERILFELFTGIE